MAKWNLERAIRHCDEMLARRYRKEIKDEIEKVKQFLTSNQVLRAYYYVNYVQDVNLEYKMGWAMWNWLSSQQPIGSSPNPEWEEWSGLKDAK